MTTSAGDDLGFRAGFLSTLPVAKKRLARFSISQHDTHIYKTCG
jgi:hypothetical protein